MSEHERIETSRLIPAPASAIFDVLCSPHGHVAIDSSGMLMSAEGRPAEAVGDTFVVHMDRDSLRDRPIELYDVTVSITKFERDRAIEWTVIAEFLDPQVGHVYGYRLEPVEHGTLVTSYYDWSAIAAPYRERLQFPVIHANSLGATLGILARTVAPGVARPVG
jgi:hypothetical protein